MFLPPFLQVGKKIGAFRWELEVRKANMKSSRLRGLSSKGSPVGESQPTSLTKKSQTHTRKRAEERSVAVLASCWLKLNEVEVTEWVLRNDCSCMLVCGSWVRSSRMRLWAQ